MIDKLLGKMVFEESKSLEIALQQKEEREELKHLDLFTPLSPSKLAKGIGTHLGCFSRDFDPLPCYLMSVDNWIDGYERIITSEKKFKKFKSYPDDELKKYLLHKVIICKVARDEVFSRNLQILTAVNHIKLEVIGYPLVAKAKKYLGLEINPYQLSSQEFESIYAQVKQLKQGN